MKKTIIKASSHSAIEWEFAFFYVGPLHKLKTDVFQWPHKNLHQNKKKVEHMPVRKFRL